MQHRIKLKVKLDQDQSAFFNSR